MVPDYVSNSPETSRSDRENYSIVIADDDGPMAELLAMNLRRLGHKVIGIARNGKETLELAYKCQPDVLILDVEMPIVDGLKAAAIIRRTRLVPIVISTGASDARWLYRANDLEIYSYLIKPFSPVQLKVALHLAVSQCRKHGHSQAALPQDDSVCSPIPA